MQSCHLIGDHEALNDEENCLGLHSQEAAEIRISELSLQCSFPKGTPFLCPRNHLEGEGMT